MINSNGALPEAKNPSFSELIIEQNLIKRKCNLGCWHNIYRVGWRAIYPEVLEKFRLFGPMTTSQLGEFFTTAGPTARKAPSELVHFGLLEVVGKRHGDKLYQITGYGIEFLDGKVRVPAWTWPADQELPPECVDGPLQFIDELIANHPGSDKALHVDLAEGMPGVRL